MVKFLDLPPSKKSRSTSDKILDTLEIASQSIGDMIGQYEKSKQMNKAADYLGLKDEKREAFLSLPQELQVKVFPSLLSESNKRRSESEKIPIEAAKHLKEFDLGLYRNQDAKNSISELSKKFYDEGLGKNESIQKAIEDYKNSQDSQYEDEESSTRQGFGMLPQGRDEESWLQSLAKERGHIDPVSGREGQESWLSRLSSPSTLKPKDILSEIGLGSLEPLESIGRGEETGNIDPVSGRNISGKRALVNYQPAPIKSILEKSHQGKTPRELEQLEAVSGLSALIPIEGMIFGLTKIGKQAGFLKNAEKLAAKAGISAEEAAQSILQQAQKEGIDLAKVAQGDKQSAGKLYNLSNRVSREAPATATELRMERAKPAEKAFPTKERIQTRETQLKEFPKYEKEIAQDALERAERAEKKIPKTIKGRQSQQIRMHEAQKALPHAEEGYRKAIARVRALEDEVVKLTGPEKERVKGLIEASKSELRDAEHSLKQGIENLRGESYRAGFSDMRQAAQKKVIQIADDIADGKKIELAKMDYNPEMIKEGKRVSEGKSLPSVKKDDFYQQVHQEYGDVYRKRLAEVNKEISGKIHSLAEVEGRANLQKEKAILQKLIDQTEAEQAIHRHKLALRETAERKKAAERLGEFKKTEANPKIEKVAKEKIEEAVRNPAGKEAEEIASQAGVKKEDVEKTVNSFKSSWEKVKENLKSPKGNINLSNEFGKFAQELQKKPFIQAFTKTPFGREILYSLGVSVANDILGLNVSPYLTAAIGRRSAFYPIRAIVSGIYRGINPKKKIGQYQYKNAVKRPSGKNSQKIADFEKKHPGWAKEARESLY